MTTAHSADKVRAAVDLLRSMNPDPAAAQWLDSVTAQLDADRIFHTDLGAALRDRLTQPGSITDDLELGRAIGEAVDAVGARIHPDRDLEAAELIGFQHVVPSGGIGRRWRPSSGEWFGPFSGPEAEIECGPTERVVAMYLLPPEAGE